MVVMMEIEPCARVSNHIDIEVRSKVQTSDTEREKEKIGEETRHGAGKEKKQRY